MVSALPQYIKAYSDGIKNKIPTKMSIAEDETISQPLFKLVAI